MAAVQSMELALVEEEAEGRPAEEQTLGSLPRQTSPDHHRDDAIESRLPRTVAAADVVRNKKLGQQQVELEAGAEQAD